METLSSPQIADVLARLFAEAQVADGPLYAEWSQALQVDGEEMARLMAREAQVWPILAQVRVLSGP